MVPKYWNSRIWRMNVAFIAHDQSEVIDKEKESVKVLLRWSNYSGFKGIY